MASGSPIVPIRIPPVFLSLIDGAIKSANKQRKLQPYNRSTWILNCVLDRINKLERGRKRAKKTEGKEADIQQE